MVIRLNNGTEFAIDSISNEVNKQSNVLSLMIVMPSNVTMESLVASIAGQDLSAIYVIDNDQVIRTYEGYELNKISENLSDTDTDIRGARNDKTMVFLTKSLNK